MICHSIRWQIILSRKRGKARAALKITNNVLATTQESQAASYLWEASLLYVCCHRDYTQIRAQSGYLVKNKVHLQLKTG